MVLRLLGATRLGAGVAEALRRLNARHPWSHNAHFHSWIFANLPERRCSALDVGCGEGELAAVLAGHFDSVLATDRDPEMRDAAATRCAGLPNVVVDGTELSEVPGLFDLVTMVAVLHHLEVERALREVHRLLAPGGRLLVVGLARPRSVVDHMWDSASTLTNPVIGFVKHPWPSPDADPRPPSPVTDPMLTFDELCTIVGRVLPGATARHRLGFRHTIAWTKPAELSRRRGR